MSSFPFITLSKEQLALTSSQRNHIKTEQREQGGPDSATAVQGLPLPGRHTPHHFASPKSISFSNNGVISGIQDRGKDEGKQGEKEKEHQPCLKQRSPCALHWSGCTQLWLWLSQPPLIPALHLAAGTHIPTCLTHSITCKESAWMREASRKAVLVLPTTSTVFILFDFFQPLHGCTSVTGTCAKSCSTLCWQGSRSALLPGEQPQATFGHADSSLSSEKLWGLLSPCIEKAEGNALPPNLPSSK